MASPHYDDGSGIGERAPLVHSSRHPPEGKTKSPDSTTRDAGGLTLTVGPPGRYRRPGFPRPGASAPMPRPAPVQGATRMSTPLRRRDYLLLGAYCLALFGFAVLFDRSLTIHET